MSCVAFEHLVKKKALKTSNWTLMGKENVTDRIE